MDDKNLESVAEVKAVPEYERPRVVDFGDLVQLTQGSSTGCYTDADFPARTPTGQLTFSC
jgi:hypothetical protein